MKRLFAHIGFSFALTLFVLNVIESQFSYIVLTGLAVLFIASLVIEKYRKALAIPLCLGSAVFACLLFITVYNSSVIPSVLLNGVSAKTNFYIIDLAKSTSSGYLYTIKTTAIMQDGAPQSVKASLFSNDVIRADAYQMICAKIDFQSVGTNAFNSEGLWSKNIYLNASIENYAVSDIYFNAPMRALLHLRHDISQTLTSYVQGDEGALAAAILIGDKTSLSKSIYNDFVYAGASHLMAVSGLHITVITTFVFYLVQFMGLKRKYASLISCGIILVYIVIAGFTGSVVRAGIMMLILLLGEISERKADSLNSLGFAVFILCINPFAVSDIGAVLSVLSVLSLITLYPVLIKTKAIRLGYVVNSVIISLCVTVYTMPAMYLFYGYVSFNSLISNIVLVFLGSVSAVMSLVTYAACSTGIFPFFFARADAFLNRAIIKITSFIADNVNLNTFLNKNFAFVFAGVLVIFAFCFVTHRKELLKPAAIICSAVLVFTFVISAVSANNSAYLFVSEGGAAVISYKNTAVVYNIDSKNDYSEVADYLKRMQLSPDILFERNAGYYSYCLCRDFGARKVVTGEYSDYYEYYNADEVIVSPKYKNDINYNFTVEYSLNEDYNYFKCRIMNKDILFGGNAEKADIRVSDVFVYDSFGLINLGKGSVVYEITQNTIDARRLNLWQE